MIGRNILQRRAYPHLDFFQMRRVGISPDHKEYIYFKVQWREHTEIKVCLMRASVVGRNRSLCRRPQLHASSSLFRLVPWFISWPVGVSLQNDLGLQNQRKLKRCILCLGVSFWASLRLCFLLGELSPSLRGPPSTFLNLCIKAPLRFSDL